MELTFKDRLFLCVSLGMVLAAHSAIQSGYTSEYMAPNTPMKLADEYPTPITPSAETYMTLAPIGMAWVLMCVLFAIGVDLGSGDDEFQLHVTKMIGTLNLLEVGFLVINANGTPSNYMWAVSTVIYVGKITVLGQLYTRLNTVVTQPYVLFDRLVLYTVSIKYFYSLLMLPVQISMTFALGYTASYVVLAISVTVAAQQIMNNADYLGLVVVLYVGGGMFAFQNMNPDRVAESIVREKSYFSIDL